MEEYSKLAIITELANRNKRFLKSAIRTASERWKQLDEALDNCRLCQATKNRCDLCPAFDKYLPEPTDPDIEPTACPISCQDYVGAIENLQIRLRISKQIFQAALRRKVWLKQKEKAKK